MPRMEPEDARRTASKMAEELDEFGGYSPPSAAWPEAG